MSPSQSRGVNVNLDKFELVGLADATKQTFKKARLTHRLNAAVFLEANGSILKWTRLGPLVGLTRVNRDRSHGRSPQMA